MLKIKFNKWLEWLKKDLVFNVIMIILSTMMLIMVALSWIYAIKTMLEKI